MTRILSLAITILMASFSTALAAHGSSSYAPGQKMHDYGSLRGYPGASGYAPGQKMHKYGSLRGNPGASGYAPGQR
jgi:hypothetical protein